MVEESKTVPEVSNIILSNSTTSQIEAELWSHAINNQWDAFDKTLQKIEPETSLDLNFIPPDISSNIKHEHAGKTLFWLLVKNQKWDLLKTLTGYKEKDEDKNEDEIKTYLRVEVHPYSQQSHKSHNLLIDLDAAPKSGPDEGVTAAGLLVIEGYMVENLKSSEAWNLFKYLIKNKKQKNPINPNTMLVYRDKNFPTEEKYVQSSFFELCLETGALNFIDYLLGISDDNEKSLILPFDFSLMSQGGLTLFNKLVDIGQPEIIYHIFGEPSLYYSFDFNKFLIDENGEENESVASWLAREDEKSLISAIKHKKYSAPINPCEDLLSPQKLHLFLYMLTTHPTEEFAPFLEKHKEKIIKLHWSKEDQNARVKIEKVCFLYPDCLDGLFASLPDNCELRQMLANVMLKKTRCAKFIALLKSTALSDDEKSTTLTGFLSFLLTDNIADELRSLGLNTLRTIYPKGLPTEAVATFFSPDELKKLSITFSRSSLQKRPLESQKPSNPETGNPNSEEPLKKPRTDSTYYTNPAPNTTMFTPTGENPLSTTTPTSPSTTPTPTPNQF